MKTIVYIALRNTRMGKSMGNFGKPISFESILQDLGAKSLYEMAQDGNIRFFDEDGDTIEEEEGIKVLKMILSETPAPTVAGVQDGNRMLILYDRDQVETVESMQLNAQEQQLPVAVSTKLIKMDDLEVINKLIKQHNIVLFVGGEWNSNMLKTAILVYHMTRNGGGHFLMYSESHEKLDMKVSEMLDLLLEVESKMDEQHYLFARVRSLISNIDKYVGEFNKSKIVGSSDLLGISNLL